nr:amine oxidase [Rhodococcus sp. JVH1]
MCAFCPSWSGIRPPPTRCDSGEATSEYLVRDARGSGTQYGTALAAPVGRITSAGAETSDIWNGYMDGAIRSGRRAADEILAEPS